MYWLQQLGPTAQLCTAITINVIVLSKSITDVSKRTNKKLICTGYYTNRLNELNLLIV